MRKKKKNRWIPIVAVIVIIVSLVAGAGWLINPYRGTISREAMVNSPPLSEVLTREAAQKDLEYLMHEIKTKHYATLKKVPEQLQNQYDLEIEQLSEQPTVVEVWQASSRILKLLEDAHSAVYYMDDTPNYLDIQLEFKNQRIICTEGPRAGQEVIAIGGADIPSLYQRFLEQFSFENTYLADARFEEYLTQAKTLNWLGLDVSKEIVFLFEDGDEIESVAMTFQTEVPTEVASEEVPFVRFEIDEVNKIGVLTIDRCEMNTLYKQTLNDFFAKIKAAKITKVVVDLRENGGGNSAVANEFMRYMPVDTFKDFGSKMRLMFWSMDSKPSVEKNKKYEDLTYYSKLYVLTSNDTFSSGTWFAVLLRDNNLCEIVGEPSGNQPSAYGDVLRYQMPNSKLGFVLTYKQFSRPDVTLDAEKALLPDVPVASDEALEEVIRIVNKK